ncbi:Response regulator receiver protein [Verrucomicrobia bacterium]|nr:Response regulator receiver protein [Verrucomicrobiota bacterium]
MKKSIGVGTILLVENDPNEQALIEEAFRANGMTGPLQKVGDGVEAISYLMGEGKYADRIQFPYPSLILTDLHMPRADGFDVLRHLKSNPTWAIIPTVVLTASSDPEDVRTAYLLGANCYHVKPPSFPGLCAQLNILHKYWLGCEVPEVDSAGQQLPGKGKLGDRFPHPSPSKQSRVQN